MLAYVYPRKQFFEEKHRLAGTDTGVQRDAPYI